MCTAISLTMFQMQNHEFIFKEYCASWNVVIQGEAIITFSFSDTPCTKLNIMRYVFPQQKRYVFRCPAFF